ncbi:MAG: ribonuclease P protein component [Canibacter sp.]
MAKPHRITAGSDYRNTVRRGRRVGGGITIAYAVFVSPETPARFGYIISKAVGNAVVRNRTRRRMKAISDELVREGFTGADVVFRALPAAKDAKFSELNEEMRRQLTKLNRAG